MRSSRRNAVRIWRYHSSGSPFSAITRFSELGYQRLSGPWKKWPDSLAELRPDSKDDRDTRVARRGHRLARVGVPVAAADRRPTTAPTVGTASYPRPS